MIAKDRNRAFMQFVCALILTVLQLIFFLKIQRLVATQDEFVVFFLTYFSSVALWMLGSYNLAKAKGYDSHTIGGVFIVLFIAGFCVPMAALLYPAVVLFGLPDKNRRGRRRSRSHTSQ